MSSIRILSGVVPSRLAIFLLMPSTFKSLALEALISPVARATMEAPLVSATKRTPSGPNARGPMDLKAGFPDFMSPVQFAALAGPKLVRRAIAVSADPTRDGILFIELV